MGISRRQLITGAAAAVAAAIVSGAKGGKGGKQRPAPTTTTTSTTVIPPGVIASPTSRTTSFVRANGTALVLHGAPYRFTGINAYQLATDYAYNPGGGQNNTQSDLTAFFSALRPNSMVRFWAFQQTAWNVNSSTRDFFTIDRVVATAATYGQKLCMTLGNQWTGQGEVFKTDTWYDSGYTTDLPANTGITVPYRDWVQEIVGRYKNNPTVGMWEPLNEPAPRPSIEDGCIAGAAARLKAFFDDVGVLIHGIDPNHLVSSGITGSGQCGSSNDDYQTLHGSAGIDICSVHDWYAAGDTMGGDAYNGIQVRLDQAETINKPLFIGECGINCATDGTSLNTRRDQFDAKMDAQFAAGIVGYMPWVFNRTAGASDFQITLTDPTFTLLHDYAL